MITGTILSIAGVGLSALGYVVNREQQKQDAREAAEEVYKKYNPDANDPQSIFDGLEEGKDGIKKIVRF